MQDSPAVVFRPASVVANDFVPPAAGVSGDTASSSSDVPRAISADFPGKLADKPGRRRSSAGDNHGGVGAGMLPGRKHVAADDMGRAERFPDNNNNGDLSSGGSRGKQNGGLPGSAIKREPRNKHLNPRFIKWQPLAAFFFRNRRPQRDEAFLNAC